MEQADYSDSRFGGARPTEGRHAYVAYFPAPIPRSLDLPPETILRLTDAEAAQGVLERGADGARGQQRYVAREILEAL